MTKPYKTLDELIEDKAKEAKKSKRKEYDEQDWRRGCESLHEGALGDY